MGDFDALIERIENARTDADWSAQNGKEYDTVSLSREDCSGIGGLITKAFGAALTGVRDSALAEKLAILSGAFKGEESDDDDDDEAS